MQNNDLIGPFVNLYAVHCKLAFWECIRNVSGDTFSINTLNVLVVLSARHMAIVIVTCGE